MGSDLSYEDMMEERKLSEIYTAKIVKEDNFNNTPVWIMELLSKVEGLAYHKRTLWIDKNKYVPLKENLYAKSGTLLKTTTFTDIRKINARWYPMKINYKDMLKDGKGTDFVILNISFDSNIPKEYFSKNILKR
jgi:outer membrane lipoprotein-sorting protein